MAGRRLPRAFFDRPTLEVARDLIGKVLVHDTPAGRTAGRIVEVEAYIGEDDPACHAAPGPTPRNAPLYGPPGVAYVYLNYGIHFLTNVVTERDGFPAAILLRALEPIEGIDLMCRRRARLTGKPASSFGIHELCRGPGNLSKASGITLRDNRRDMMTDRLTIEDWDLPFGDLHWGPRIGIRVGMERHWRCFEARCLSVSGPITQISDGLHRQNNPQVPPICTDSPT
jgi:DNA-3-methyladenine glycosylase